MEIDIQKGDVWKRISAWMFDYVIMLVLVTLIAIPLSALLKYDEKLEAVESIESEYKEEMKAAGLNPDITQEELKELETSSPELRNKYYEIDNRRKNDERLLVGYSLLINIITTLLTTGVLLGFLILEFAVPLFFKNGQTLGKKIFGLGVVHSNALKFRGQAHFIRSIIGKCAIETLVPIYFLIMAFYGSLGLIGLILVGLLIVLQIFALITSRSRSAIHDLISDAVVVDLASQQVFDTLDDLMAYKNKIHEEMVSKSDY